MAIDYQKRDGVAYITLNNPAKANILDKATSDEISQAWIDLFMACDVHDENVMAEVTQNIERLLVRHLPRAVGRSNYTLRRLLRLWLSMFVNFSVMPLRLSTLTGFALSFIGTIGSIVVIVEVLFFDPPAGWASLMAAVMLLSGVQLLILGIVGEYLGRMYLTANRKPQSVVRSVTRAEPGFAEARPGPSRAAQRQREQA